MPSQVEFNSRLIELFQVTVEDALEFFTAWNLFHLCLISELRVEYNLIDYVLPVCLEEWKGFLEFD